MSLPNNDEMNPKSVVEVKTPTKRSKRSSSTSAADSSADAHKTKSPRKTKPNTAVASTPAQGGTNIVTPSTTATTTAVKSKAVSSRNSARRSLIPSIKEEASPKKLPFGGTSLPIQVSSTVKRVYQIINKQTGSIGGNSHGGAIYGELTVGSMQKMVNLMMEHTGLGPTSRFIDVGCGLGKPNIHVCQTPTNVEFSYGIEMEHVRWMLGIANMHQVLRQAKSDEGRSDGGDDTIGHACILEHGDIRQAKYFDPFTHVYMFDIGFPPRLFHILADMFNNSSSQYLICYHGPRLMIDTYEFDVELITKTSTSMHGSSEVHSGYIYKRCNKRSSTQSKCKAITFGEPCDPLFANAWKICRSGLDGVLKHTEEQVERHIQSTTKRVTRSSARNAS